MSKEHILNTAYDMAIRDGFYNITRDGVAAEAGVAMGSVNHHYGTMDTLRDEVIRRAVDENQLGILAQALMRGNPIAMTVSKKLQVEALTSIVK